MDHNRITIINPHKFKYFSAETGNIVTYKCCQEWYTRLSITHNNASRNFNIMWPAFLLFVLKYDNIHWNYIKYLWRSIPIKSVIGGLNNWNMNFHRSTEKLLFSNHHQSPRTGLKKKIWMMILNNISWTVLEKTAASTCYQLFLSMGIQLIYP